MELKESKMQAYTNFAEVYDIFMDNIPYEEWAEYLDEILKEYHIPNNMVLELGCGTGNMTELLADKGYDMIGVDNSEIMLEIAMEKRLKSGHDILYLLQDMQAFELYGTVGGIVSVCDSINYVTDERELKEVFSLVNNYLDPRGIFVFDFNTEYKYRELLGDRVIAEEREECSFIWDNYYNPEDKMNEYQLTLFVQNEDDKDLYRRYQEVHYQRAYTLEKIKTLIEKAGLRYVAAYDAYTKKAPMYTSGRICVIAQEYGK
jgi:ubiquinone/menaquinone biosynthesis C-methylase UbiE